MNKIFNQVDDRGKIIISEFIKEEKLGVIIYFKPEAQLFLNEQYKRIYGIWISKANNSLTALIIGILKEEIIKVQMIKHSSGSDHCYQIFTPPLYFNGIQMEIPINLIKDLTIFNTMMK